MHFRPMAYLDPGSGSVLLQVAIAVILGLGVAIRASWGRIKSWLGIKPAPQEDDDEADNE